LLPIQITCVFEKNILMPDIFLNHSNSKSVSFYEKYLKKMKGLLNSGTKEI
jgi:hypothetical protein